MPEVEGEIPDGREGMNRWFNKLVSEAMSNEGSCVVLSFFLHTSREGISLEGKARDEGLLETLVISPAFAVKDLVPLCLPADAGSQGLAPITCKEDPSMPARGNASGVALHNMAKCRQAVWSADKQK